ncbi:hypothetical protein [Cytophaga hutchinsonii]|jgi:hypothetical protein|uniref:Uncharacterized protein n=1 Tax=Cytophaga hutchinsonii (strain ATCC 33406 / DSM 1761 / CIP 103989 / NBRC 15051 / NCIMB 9469 / D465) TaxID=269798 RepID=A0A6N4SP28_CYTH3|nr:hypothetical protein [Cytophaga hutchinsonii]ABG58029.1 hypothetical protein CHU_0742 [Cytophaga hutchinsonii ATCC 33406]SFX11812.1 hypothetical protein SAMN04487930_101581 [Cytophaga hutchinsonii ATCC 33406]
MSKQLHPVIEKLLHFRIIFLIAFLFLLFFTVAVFFTIDMGNSQSDSTRKNFYRTWKVLRFYQNGKLVVNDKKFEELRFKINDDSTAEWIRPNSTITIRAWISPEGNQIIKEDEELLTDIDNVYEIQENKLRFGKRTLESHYEYVMVPE